MPQQIARGGGRIRTEHVGEVEGDPPGDARMFGSIQFDVKFSPVDGRHASGDVPVKGFRIGPQFDAVLRRQFRIARIRRAAPVHPCA